MVFCYSLAFSMIQQMLAVWSLVPLPFLNPAYTFESSQFKYYWSLAWRILSITLLVCEDECNCVVVWTFIGITFFGGTEMKTDFFQSYGHCWVFQICWHIECSTLTASSFRTWNSSARIPSSPLAFCLKKRKCKKAKWLSEEAFQIAEKRREAKSKWEKERYTNLKAQF